MANELTTAGISVMYAVEATIDVRPTAIADYTLLPSIKEIPELNPEAEGLEVTDLSDTEWKRYTDGLKDPGSSLGFMANHTQAFQTAWETMVSAAETGEAASKATWYAVIIPGVTKTFFVAGKPVDLGLAQAGVNGVLETTGYITPNQIAGWAAALTV
jgi:hypothetical protein